MEAKMNILKSIAQWTAYYIVVAVLYAIGLFLGVLQVFEDRKVRLAALRNPK